MLVRYSLANLPSHRLGQASQTLSPAGPPATPLDQTPPSNMIQPAQSQAEALPPPLPMAPTVAPAAGPQPRWIEEGSHDLGRTLAAACTVAALALLGFLVFK
jgi:hypothetical protein